MIISISLPGFPQETSSRGQTSNGSGKESGSELTWQRAVVGDEAGHVHVLVVHAQVLHAAHKLPVADGEVLGELRNPSEEQGPGQVQRPGETHSYADPRCFASLRLMRDEKFITVSQSPPPQGRNPSPDKHSYKVQSLEMWDFKTS